MIVYTPIQGRYPLQENVQSYEEAFPEVLKYARDSNAEHLKAYEGKSFVPTFGLTDVRGGYVYEVSNITETSAEMKVSIVVKETMKDTTIKQYTEKMVMRYSIKWWQE